MSFQQTIHAVPGELTDNQHQSDNPLRTRTYFCLCFLQISTENFLVFQMWQHIWFHKNKCFALASSSDQLKCDIRHNMPLSQFPNSDDQLIIRIYKTLLNLQTQVSTHVVFLGIVIKPLNKRNTAGRGWDGLQLYKQLQYQHRQFSVSCPMFFSLCVSF